jgi:L-alanine-DL-glutamate epimerase-like enolase superfamily enzyme
MKITAIRLYTVPLTSRQTYYMSDGKTCATVESVVLRLDTDGGLTGWGEVCPIPGYLPASAASARAAIAELAPALLGADPVGPEAVMARLDRLLPGHRHAKSAIDIALWDLTGKAAGLPLHALMGGRRAVGAPLYHSISCLAPEAMAETAVAAQAQGIGQFQAKLGADDDWQADVARLRAVRGAVGDGPLVYGDWNTGAAALDALRVARAVADLDVMLEQPCATLANCATVRDKSGLPMKLDESVHDTDSILAAHRLGCVDVATIKLSKFGGLSAARRARDLCAALAIQMTIEDVWGSDIVTAASLHLAVATAPRHLLNVCDLSGYVTPRLAPEGPARGNDGTLTPPAGPGLGIEIDPGVLGDPVAAFG